MKKQIRTYEATFRGETRRERSSREIVWGSVGLFSDGSWFLTLSAQADPAKAKNAARSSNRYVAESILVPVTLVEEAA